MMITNSLLAVKVHVSCDYEATANSLVTINAKDKSGLLWDPDYLSILVFQNIKNIIVVTRHAAQRIYNYSCATWQVAQQGLLGPQI